MACHGLVVLGYLAMGTLYLLRPRFMPYHQQVAKMSWEALGTPLQTLVLALLKGSGLAMIVAAATLALLLAFPFRRNERWAVHGVAALGLLASGSLLVLLLWLKETSGAATPYPAVALAVVLHAVGWLLSRAASAK
jgi:uncharacterized membrane protein